MAVRMPPAENLAGEIGRGPAEGGAQQARCGTRLSMGFLRSRRRSHGRPAYAPWVAYEMDEEKILSKSPPQPERSKSGAPCGFRRIHHDRVVAGNMVDQGQGQPLMIPTVQSP